METERDYGYDDEQEWEPEDDELDEADPDELDADAVPPDPLEHPFQLRPRPSGG